MDFIPTWAAAIAQVEGFGSSPGNRPTRLHNPGDLKFAGQAGAVGQDAGGFAIFPDDATGFQALYNQLAKYVSDFPGYSLLQITAHYLGQGSTPAITSQGNAFTYAASVAGALGVSVDITLGQLAAGELGAPAPGGDPSGGGLPAAGPDVGTLFWAVAGVALLYVVLSR